jgi:hypothetical protein
MAEFMILQVIGNFIPNLQYGKDSIKTLLNVE